MSEKAKDEAPQSSDFPQPVQSVIEHQPSLDSVTVVDEHEQQDDKVNKDDNADSDFPEGGLRAWLMVIAATGLVMATFGVVNSFVRHFRLCRRIENH